MCGWIIEGVLCRCRVLDGRGSAQGLPHWNVSLPRVTSTEITRDALPGPVYCRQRTHSKPCMIVRYHKSS